MREIKRLDVIIIIASDFTVLKAYIGKCEELLILSGS